MQNEGLLTNKKIPLKQLLKRTMKYVWPYKKSFIVGLILVFINVGLDIVTPLIVGEFTKNITSINPTLNIVIWCAVGTIAISIINQCFLYFESMILTKAGQAIVYDLRMDVFSHIEKMSQNQFNEMAVGSLVTRVCNYTTSMTDFFTNTLVKILRNALTVVGVYIIMMVILWKLGLVLLGIIILVFIVSYIFSRSVHKIFNDERNQLSELNTYLNEALSGMKIIQFFNHEKISDRTFINKNEKYRRTRYKITIAFGIYRPLISFIYLGAVAVTLYLGVLWKLGPGNIVSFYLYLGRFFRPIQELADELNHITRASTAAEKLFNLMDIKPEVIEQKDAIDIAKFKGKIEFKNVWFAYEKNNWILKDVSFVVNPKETVAFIGATGAGKTTILSLIVRNFEIQKGQILIDDIDIKNIKMDSLRRGVGQMLQDVFLFSGTVRDNITLFDDRFTDENIIKAAEYVNADQVINHLPNSYQERIIERGENLSTGQRQLLSFARTVLHKPQIMILDEATANIDTETELKIQESLEKMKNIGTMLIVAHRLSTIQHSDKIIVLNHGEIVETGNHQQLLKRKGLYYSLYKLQFEK